MSADRTPAQVLFVGLGAMGAPMLRRVTAAGHAVGAYDVDEIRTRSVAADAGALAVGATGLRQAAGAASVVVLMLPDSAAVESVLQGPDGLLAVMTAGSTVVDMGSSRPTSTQALSLVAAEAGIALVDAPVSGGVAKARTGQLSVMAGGTADDVERVRPVVSAMGTVTHVGPVGAGHAMKALNNLLSALGLAAASEVLAVGTAFGLEPAVMLDVLNASTGRNHATEVKMAQFVLSRSFDSGFALRLMVKDLRTALDLAHDTATPVPLSAGCLEQWTAAARDLEADADHTRIAAYVEARAGVELSSPVPRPPVQEQNQ